MRLQRNYYEVMGLPRNATALEIKKKYHDLVREFHPDRAGNKETATRLLTQINLAYGTLIDARRRSLYDAGLPREHLAADRPATTRTAHSDAPAVRNGSGLRFFGWRKKS